MTFHRHLAAGLYRRLPSVLILVLFWAVAVGTAGATQSFTRMLSSGQAPEVAAGVYRLADWNDDGVLDLFHIKTFGTGSGRTEVQVFDGRSAYRNAIVRAVTPLHSITGSPAPSFEIVDWDRDGTPDVVMTQASSLGTGSGTTEFHVLSGRTRFATWLLHTASAIADDHGNFHYRFADWNNDGFIDAFAIKTSATGSNSTEVHILDGRAGFRRFLLQTATPLHTTGENFDYSIVDTDSQGRPDGKPDLVAIKKYRTAGSVEVHIVSGRSAFQRWVLQDGTVIPQVDAAVYVESLSFASVSRSNGGALRLALQRVARSSGWPIPAEIVVAEWPLGGSTSPGPGGTTFTVRNCNRDVARIDLRRNGTVVGSAQLLPRDNVGYSFLVPSGETREIWAYLRYGTPLDWHGGFLQYVTGSTGQAAIAFGVCP